MSHLDALRMEFAALRSLVKAKRRTERVPARVYHGTPVQSPEHLEQVLGQTHVHPRADTGHEGGHWGGVAHSNPEMTYFSTRFRQKKSDSMPHPLAQTMHLREHSKVGVGVVFTNARRIDPNRVHPDEDFLRPHLTADERVRKDGHFQAQKRLRGQWSMGGVADSLAHHGSVEVRPHGYTISRWSHSGEDPVAKHVAKHAEGRVETRGNHYFVPHTPHNADLLRALVKERSQ